MDQTSTHIVENKGVEKVEEGGVLSWSAMYRMLLVYGEKHGTHDVPPSVVVSLSNGSYFKLGEWLEVQREEYKFQRLSSSKASMLQALVNNGTLHWTIPNQGQQSEPPENLSNQEFSLNDFVWENNFSALMKYLKVNGHCDVPSDYVVKYAASTRELKLGQWSRVQFRRLKNNQLSSYKATKLRGLLEEAALLRQKRRMEEWSLYYSLFLTFGSTRGYYDVPLPFVCVNPQSGTIYPLGKWLREQQQAYLAKKLPAALAQLFQKFVDEGSFCWEFESAESSGEKNLREERPQKKPRS